MPRTPLLLLLLLCAPLATPRPASAQAFQWLLPVGGEVWTAGTSHSLAWTGGPGTPLDVEIIDLTINTVVNVPASGIPYTLGILWNVAPTQTPGPYEVYIEDSARTTWTYGPAITIVAPPACAPGCQRVSIGPQMYGYSPAASCATTLAAAQALATSSIQSQIASSCPSGFSVDNSSIAIDLTQTPYGACSVGQTGAFAVEATATFCCCPTTTGTRHSTWSGLKAHYR